nr:hypothetical protein [Desulfobulbaceae bacterium]
MKGRRLIGVILIVVFFGFGLSVAEISFAEDLQTPSKTPYSQQPNPNLPVVDEQVMQDAEKFILEMQQKMMQENQKIMQPKIQQAMQEKMQKTVKPNKLAGNQNEKPEQRGKK